MKKIVIGITAVLSSFISIAQTVDEAVLFSSEKTLGTARLTAMGGAFGALGGDLSALSINPAGSSVFLANYGSFSLSNNSYTNDVTYKDGFSSTTNNNLDVNQAGAVFVFNNYNPEAKITKFALAINYEKTNTLYNRYSAIGTNDISIGDYFESIANGVPLGLFKEPGRSIDDTYISLGETNFSAEGFNNSELQTAYLAYEAYLFDPLDENNNNTVYASNITGNDFQQEYNYASTGLNGKFSANASLAIQDKYYVGLNLNSHFINYTRSTSFYEQINGPSSINDVYFENSLNTLGSGFSFQVGGIAKFGKNIRAGVAYKSPTWYTISEETTQSMASSGSSVEATDNFIGIRPNVTNIYPDYHYRTPGEITGSLAYLFGDRGLLSLDYSYKDYSNIHYADFNQLNQAIENNLNAVSTLRLGGEYRFSAWSFRGGFQYQGSPYKNTNFMSDTKGYSAGLGYNFGNVKLDFAYLLSTYEQRSYLKQTGIPDTAYIDNNNSTYVLTLSFGL